MPRADADIIKGNMLGQFARGGQVAAPVAAVFGFVADVLAPLGPINGILFAVSLLVFLPLAYRFYRHRRGGTIDMSRKVPERAMVFTSFLLLGFGIWFALQLVAAVGDRGVVANRVASLSSLQDALMGVRKDIAEVSQAARGVQADTAAIRRDTESIGSNIEGLRTTSVDIARNTATVAETTAAMAEGITQLTDKFTRVGEGGLIAEPASPSDFYHNARLQELSGRFREAFESYRSYLGFDQEFIDPCLSYLELVRSQQGQEAAEADFAALATRFPGNRAIALTGLAIKAGKARRDGVEQFAEHNSDFGPALWLASREYSIDTVRMQSSLAVEKEKMFLEKMCQQDTNGGLKRWFLDKRRAAELVQSAIARLNEIETKRLGVRVLPGEQEDNEWYRQNWQDIGLLGLTVSIHDGFVRDAQMSIDDEDWTAMPVRQAGERLYYLKLGIYYSDACRIMREKLRSDPATEAVLWVKYRDQDGLESEPIQVCRFRGREGRGVQCRAAAALVP